MTNKVQAIGENVTQSLRQKHILRETSVEKYYLAMSIPSNSFKFKNAKREEIYKILTKIDPNKAHGIYEIS